MRGRTGRADLARNGGYGHAWPIALRAQARRGGGAGMDSRISCCQAFVAVFCPQQGLGERGELRYQHTTCFRCASLVQHYNTMPQ